MRPTALFRGAVTAVRSETILIGQESRAGWRINGAAAETGRTFRDSEDTVRERDLPPVRPVKNAGAIRLGPDRHGKPMLWIPASAPSGCASAFMRGWRRGGSAVLRDRNDARLLWDAREWAESLCGSLRVPVPEIVLTGNARLWGSCAPAKGQVRLHADLSRMPDGVIREVLLHELCHLREPEHNRGFWDLMGGIMPDWAEWEGLLRCLGRKRGR